MWARNAAVPWNPNRAFMSQVCQRCKRARATVHVTDSFPDKRERHLCEGCAVEEGILIKQHETTAAILQEFVKQKTGLGKFDELACPRCGTTFREFQEKGLLGCPQDYAVFHDVLMPLIERAHEGGTHHVGKSPPKADAAARSQSALMRLRRQLQEAVEQEDYETAARVRDQIRALESV